MPENPIARFHRIAALEERLCIGLLSGTSADGVDAALCCIRGRGLSSEVELLGFRNVPFEPELRDRIHGVESVREVCELNFILGERFAQAALALVDGLGFAPEQIHVIGSHGQTVQHLPTFLASDRSTLQIGEPAVIAERTGIATVADFRVRDVAAGGEGAPLVPLADYVLFRSRGRVRLLQNIGGIANVSVVSERFDQLRAFDVGPGNVLLDHLVRRLSDGREPFDRDGCFSCRGRPIPALLDELLAHPFLALPPPKSTGREVFGPALADALLLRFVERPWDLLATVAAFTARAIRKAYDELIAPVHPADELFVSGGGSRNPTIMRELTAAMAPMPVASLDVLGVPEYAREAITFALLAHLFLDGESNNVPAATGAERPVVMGKLCL